jgi:CarboxypepD_reg-like domain
MKSIKLILLFLLVGIVKTLAQGGGVDADLVQFSGMVLTEEGGKLSPVPFATISVKGTSRGTLANYKGFFSIVVKRKEVVHFSALGFTDVDSVIPDTLKGTRYAVVQLLSADEVNLPELIVFPWPNRDHFKQEFLNMDVSNALADNASANLARERMQAIRDNTKMDGSENSKYYLQQVAQRNYSIGQLPPMPIFNVVSWAQFFTAWQRGDFKKKKKR